MPERKIFVEMTEEEYQQWVHRHTKPPLEDVINYVIDNLPMDHKTLDALNMAFGDNCHEVWTLKTKKWYIEINKTLLPYEVKEEDGNETRREKIL